MTKYSGTEAPMASDAPETADQKLRLFVELYPEHEQEIRERLFPTTVALRKGEVICDCPLCDLEPYVQAALAEAAKFHCLVVSGLAEYMVDFERDVRTGCAARARRQADPYGAAEIDDSYVRAGSLGRWPLDLDCQAVRALIIEHEFVPVYGDYAAGRLRHHDEHRGEDEPPEPRRRFFSGRRYPPSGGANLWHAFGLKLP